MAIQGELSPQEQEIVDFFDTSGVYADPLSAEKAVKAAQKMFDKAQVEVDKAPTGSPQVGQALRRRDLALLQLLRAKAFRTVVANNYTSGLTGEAFSQTAKKEQALVDLHKGDATDYLTFATTLSGEIKAQVGPVQQYRQAESTTPAIALATTEPTKTNVPPKARPAAGAVGQTVGVGQPTPTGQPTSAGQFRMAEAAAGQPTAATMAKVEKMKPAARATRKTTTGGGVDTTGAIPPSTAAEAGAAGKDKRPWQKIIQQEFGAYAAYIGIDPTVDKALEKFAKGEIDGTRFDAIVRSSQWWKNTNEFIRQWDLKERTAGSTAPKEIADRVQQMRDYALAEFGVSLPPESVQAFARESLRQGMQDPIWQNGVGSIIVKGDNLGAIDQLRSGSVGQKLRKINADYGYDASPDFINKSISNVVTGTMTTASYRDEVLKQVKALYGQDVGQLLDQGYTISDVAQPYMNVAAKTLEVDRVDFADPKFRAALNFKDPNGIQRRMTLSEWEKTLRTDPAYGWEYTDSARGQARRAVDTILRSFGKVR